MSSSRAAARLYRDFEKLFRLAALYQGKAKPLEQHTRVVDANLATFFKVPDAPQSFQFDFFMSGVYFQGGLIFQHETPESTLAYSLFCEGVQAIVITREITAQQLLNFCLKIREFFDKENEGQKDLASMLWKQTFPNLRIYLYNLLLESDKSGSGKGREADAQSELALQSGDAEVVRSVKSVDQWNERDKEWELPSGELAVQAMGQVEDLNEKQIDTMREELADVSLSDRAQKIVRFQQAEIESLAAELESYDENQVQFNLIAHQFSLLRTSSQLATDAFLSNLAKTIGAVVERFHGGILAFVLSEIDRLKSESKAAEGIQKISEFIQKGLKHPKRIQTLADSFSQANRVSICKALMKYLDDEGLFALIERVVDQGGAGKLEAFTMALVEHRTEEFVFSRLADRLLLPLIHSVQSAGSWKGRGTFLQRCLTHRSIEVVRSALPSIGGLKLSTADALRLFGRLNEGDRKVWVKSLLAEQDITHWGAFLQQIVKENSWMQSDEELMFLWVRAALDALGQQSLTAFEPFVAGRRLFFWAKFPREREAILLAAMQTRDKRLRSKLEEWVKRESQLLFQSSELKNRLRSQ